VSDIKAEVRDYILSNFLMGGDRESLRDDESFLERRILDSTGFIELVTYIEQHFGVRIEDDEIAPENLDSLDNIEAFVLRKRAA